MKRREKLGLRWLGVARYIPGVPRRDLEPDEVESFGQTREALIASGLYEPAAPAAKPVRAGEESHHA